MPSRKSSTPTLQPIDGSILGEYAVENWEIRRIKVDSNTSSLRSCWRRNQKIALSKGVNDSGLFEPILALL
ncbi:hypothetical protein NIES2100_63120 [Calothrix sp. NIES-2100]|uniref:hypothetical protein n=1 Tax=Calothrix sp. NIES-2100 TaxID=1954172 RepID=UPI000B5F7223|nr:hypothetical protein NIES2100_63120 [Calothrix sp. NIES-2100]